MADAATPRNPQIVWLAAALVTSVAAVGSFWAFAGGRYLATREHEEFKANTRLREQELKHDGRREVDLLRNDLQRQIDQLRDQVLREKRP